MLIAEEKEKEKKVRIPVITALAHFPLFIYAVCYTEEFPKRNSRRISRASGDTPWFKTQERKINDLIFFPTFPNLSTHFFF